MYIEAMTTAAIDEPTVSSSINRWAALEGRWTFSDGVANYNPPHVEAKAPHGIAVSNARMRRGTASTKVELTDVINGCARLLFGLSSDRSSYFSAGIGGYGSAYVIDEFSGNGWQSVAQAGSCQNLESKRSYELVLTISGQAVRLVVDGIQVLEARLPHPLLGDQLGVFAWGVSDVAFRQTSFQSTLTRAFVVMQFAEPYDSLYREVIKPVAEQADFTVFRADDVFRPGIILQDILRSITTSDVIIAEITPTNPNVYYELGYAHAIGKPTILLAEKDADPAKHLPFDISGFRVIFYDDTIRGKRNVEIQLRQHLSNIREGRLEELL